MIGFQHAEEAAAADKASGLVNRPKGRGSGAAAHKPKIHSISTVKPIRNYTPASRRQATPAPPVTQPRASACPNPSCEKPQIEDGICHSCGTIVSESNIVSEVSFGENSAGAAVLQGTFIGNGKGYTGGMGPGFNRIGGTGESDGHYNTIEEGKLVMHGLAQTFGLEENVVSKGMQTFKMAAMGNFCQGRRISIVAACSLYVGARLMKDKQQNPTNAENYCCKVMLIDFADYLGLNVFNLTKTYKAMLKGYVFVNMPHALPEDLMLRFALKLDFGTETTTVAQTACRLAQRMNNDWMVTGRRPAGICGACILMAARLHNYRRTVQEVVYVVKVAYGTIEKRLDEFKYTAASNLTVEQFMNHEEPSSMHDPPAFYQQTEEYKKTRKTRKRKRGTETLDIEDDEQDAGGQEASEDNDRERSGSSSSSPTPGPISQPQLDADGFAIPALPAQKKARMDNGTASTPSSSSSGIRTGDDANVDDSVASSSESQAPTEAPVEHEFPIDPSLLDSDAAAQGMEDLEHLARNLGDVAMPEPFNETSARAPAQDDDAEFEAEIEQTITNFMELPGTKEKVGEVVATHFKDHPPLRSQMREYTTSRDQIQPRIMDPRDEGHQQHFELARLQADFLSQVAATTAPSRFIPMDVNIADDEFADDDEVNGFLLGPEEVAIKEKLWLNENKQWLLEKLERDQKKREEAKKPKVKRARKKIDRIGAGQKEPMATSHEAAAAALQRRTAKSRGKDGKPSSKINYSALQQLFDRPDGSIPSSASTSRATSVVPPRRAGSAKLAAVARSRAASRATSVASSVTGNDSDYISNVGSTAHDVGNSLLSEMDDDDDDVVMGGGDEYDYEEAY